MAVTISRTADVDDDGTLTTGTVRNNAWKQELYDQIDTALALLLPLAGGTITGAVTFNAGVTLAAGQTLTVASGNDLKLNVPSARSLLIQVNGVTKNTMDANGNWNGLSLAAGTALTEETGNDLKLNVPSTRSLLIQVNGFTKLTMDNAGALTLSGIPAFVTGDKYLVVSAGGAVHVSAIGPAS